jgi:hypothetical protein
MFYTSDDQSLPFPESQPLAMPLHAKIERHLSILTELIEESGLQNSRFALMSFVENYRHEMQLMSGELGLDSINEATPQEVYDFNQECERVVNERIYKIGTRRCVQYDNPELFAEVELIGPDWPDSKGDTELEQSIRDICLTPAGKNYLAGIELTNSNHIREALTAARDRLAMQKLLDTSVVFV